MLNVAIVVLFLIHVANEQLCDYALFRNSQIVPSQAWDVYFPCSRFRAVWLEGFGLAVVGVLAFPLGFGAGLAGFIFADTLAHLSYTIKLRKHTPGFASVVPVFGLTVWQSFQTHWDGWAVAQAVSAAGFLGVVFLVDYFRGGLLRDEMRRRKLLGRKP